MAGYIKAKKILVYERCCTENIDGVRFLKDFDNTIIITNYYGQKISKNLKKRLPAVLLENGRVVQLNEFIKSMKKELFVLAKNDEQIVYDAGDKVIIENKPT